MPRRAGRCRLGGDRKPGRDPTKRGRIEQASPFAFETLDLFAGVLHDESQRDARTHVLIPFDPSAPRPEQTVTSISQTVLISGARAPVALHLTRLFGEAGCRVVLVDQLAQPLAANSRFASRYVQIPPFATQRDAATEVLRTLIAEENIALVVPTCEEVLHLGRIWSDTQMGAPLFSPDFATLKRVHNKYEFIQLCAEIGLPHPDTQLLNDTSDLQSLRATSTDLVLKPVWSRFGAEVLIQPSAEKLMQFAPNPQTPWVAQAYIPGSEVCCYAIAQNGRLVTLAAYQGIVRAGPGAAVCFAPIQMDIVRPFVERFVAETCWTGQVSFDLMLTETGQVLPLECNPRATSGLHFFRNGNAFKEAVLKGEGSITPDVTTPLAVRLALWLYGAPMMLRRRQRQTFTNALKQAGDVMDWPGDTVGLRAQLRSVAELARLARRHRIGLAQASTLGIEWDGVSQ